MPVFTKWKAASSTGIFRAVNGNYAPLPVVYFVKPANWTVISDMTVIMGGIDDKRLVQAPTHDKILVLKGTSIMGGLEIKSY